MRTGCVVEKLSQRHSFLPPQEGLQPRPNTPPCTRVVDSASVPFPNLKRQEHLSTFHNSQTPKSNSVLIMRQRITFIQDPADSVNPELLQVSQNSIATKSLKAAREDRITFGFEELPQELYRVLKASHEVHIRWAGDRAFEGKGPLIGRISPGLHVFYTPQRNSNDSYVQLG